MKENVLYIPAAYIMASFKYIIKLCPPPTQNNNTKPTVTETILCFFFLKNAYFRNEELKVLTEKNPLT